MLFSTEDVKMTLKGNTVKEAGMGYGMKIFNIRDVVPQLPNIFFRRRMKFHFELLPFEARGLSAGKIFNFFLVGLNQYFLPSKPFGYPVMAQVEPTNFCNLSCPLCLTTSETNSRPRAMLSFETFKHFIDDLGKYLLLIILWNWGEPFLNPDIFRIITYAKSKNILVHSSTNGNVKFNDEKADLLVGSGLDSLIFAVDGATQETYSKYRKGGRLERVLENIETIVRAKKRRGSKTPRVNVRIVVMQHNEKEVHLVRQFAEQLDVDFFSVKTVAMVADRGKDLDRSFAPADPKYRMYEYEAKGYKRKEKPFVCMRPWKRITLDAMGEIIPCEYEYKNVHSFGRLDGKISATSIWKGPEAQVFREEFNLGDNEFYLCKDCVYKNRVADDCTIERVMLKKI
jgi:radical SAM protein with 4Fe4S-binding SPASM domain